MAPMLTSEAIDLNNDRGSRKWTWIKALDESDYRRTNKAARVINVFADAALIGRWPYMAQQVRSRSDMEPDDLKPGQIIIMVNRAKTGFAILTYGHNITFHRIPEDNRRLTMEDFNNLGRAYNNDTGLDFDPALERFIIRYIEGRREKEINGNTKETPALPK